MAYANRNCGDCEMEYRPKTSNQKRCSACRELRQYAYERGQGRGDAAVYEGLVGAQAERKKRFEVVAPIEDIDPHAYDEKAYDDAMELLVAAYNGNEPAAAHSVHLLAETLRGNVRQAFAHALGNELDDELWERVRGAISATLPPSTLVKAVLHNA
jgi:hypothetical protein